MSLDPAKQKQSQEDSCQTAKNPSAHTRFGARVSATHEKRQDNECSHPQEENRTSPREPITAGFLANLDSAPQFGENGFEICDHRLHAFRLRSHAQQVLLEVEIKGQRTRELERETRFIFSGQILLRTREGEDFAVQFYSVHYFFLSGLFRVVRKVEHVCLQERAFLVDFQYLKALVSLGDDVETAVIIFFCDCDDFSCTTNLSHALLLRPHHTEGTLPGQALADHILITRLEDMQRQRHARK